jgi:hypothetical protein
MEHGQRLICMDGSRLPQILAVTDQDIEQLQRAELACVTPPTPQLKERIDYVALQQTYARMLVEGPCSTQTELARHLGVSRVWVSRVLKGIKRNTG